MTTSSNNYDIQFQHLSKEYKNKPDGYYGLDRVEMLPFIPSKALRILDIGCADGAFGKMLKKENSEIIVWGIEPHIEAAKRANQVLNKVINGVFEDNLSELEKQKFDVIVFNDVIEHLVSPDKTLKLCHKYLDEKGYIVASIPNILFYPILREILVTQDWRYRDHGTLDNTHLKFFTKKSIIRLFEENGYEIKKIEGINRRPCGKLYAFLNFIFFRKLKDWKFLQFGLQAQKNK